jgi:hypothetical protein
MKQCFHHVYFCLPMFPPCSFLFPLFNFILEYLRAAVDLVWICFLSFHLCFPEFLISCQFLKKPSKIKLLEKFQKILFKFLCQKWAERHLGHPRGTHHSTTPHGGAARARPHRGMVWAPWPSTYLSTLHFTLSPEISSLHSSNPCFCCSCSQFFISLLSPFLLLRFGAFVLRYVTPSIVQVEFCLVEYFLSILAL